MPQFEYSPFNSAPYAASVAELLTRQADPYARAAVASAAARARAQEISGEVWGRAIGAIGAIPAQIQQSQQQAVRTEGEALKLSEQKRAVAERTAFGKILAETPMLKVNGMDTYDIPTLTQKFSAQGLDAATLVPHLGELNDTFEKFNAGRQAVIVTGATKVHAAGDDPDLALQFMDAIEGNGVYSKAQIDKFRELIHVGGQPAVAKLTAYLMGPQKPTVLKPGETGFDPSGHPIPGMSVPEKADEGAYTINGQRFDRAGNRIGALVPSQAAPKSIESKNVLLDGKPAIVNFDPASGRYFLPGADRSQWGTRADGSPKGNGFLGVLQRPDGRVSSEISIGVTINGKDVEIPTLVPTLSPQERDWLITNDVSNPSKIPAAIVQKAVDFAKQRIAAGQSPFASAAESPAGAGGGGQDVSARVSPIPPASTIINPAMIPSGDALDMAARKYLATGDLPSMGMGQAGVAARIAVMNRAAAIDPQASLAANKAIYKADSANLTKLQTTEGTLSAFENTAGKNLDQFLALAEQIPDTGTPWLNTPVRLLNAQIVGSANMAAITAARDVALREIARVTNDPKLSGALTDSARAEVLGLSPQNATLPQIKAVAKVLKQDMANVHKGVNEQIETVKAGLGANPAAPGPVDTKGTDIKVGGFTVKMKKG